jgi:hypothetical protein
VGHPLNTHPHPVPRRQGSRAHVRRCTAGAVEEVVVGAGGLVCGTPGIYSA